MPSKLSQISTQLTVSLYALAVIIVELAIIAIELKK